MSQTTAKLVYMANQIAQAFRHQEGEKAVAATYDHLRRFWDPRMRRLILEHLQGGGEGLNDIARAAVAKLAVGAEPATVTRATEFSGVGDADPASDAG